MLIATWDLATTTGHDHRCKADAGLLVDVLAAGARRARGGGGGSGERAACVLPEGLAPDEQPRRRLDPSCAHILCSIMGVAVSIPTV